LPSIKKIEVIIAPDPMDKKARFVILYHQLGPNSERDHDHWDLMFEFENYLKTWALDANPFTSTSILATQLPDHRLIYLEYQGDVGGGRGVVSNLECGEYTLESSSANQFVAKLAGRKLNGSVKLSRIENNRWIANFTAANIAGC
jgi:hypothetical protein